MGVTGEAVEHPSDLTKVPGRIIERRMVRVYSFRTFFFYENGSRGREVLTDFLGDAELKSIMSDGYNAYVFIGNELKSARFKDTIHQVCMSHA